MTIVNFQIDHVYMFLQLEITFLELIPGYKVKELTYGRFCVALTVNGPYTCTRVCGLR